LATKKFGLLQFTANVYDRVVEVSKESIDGLLGQVAVYQRLGQANNGPVDVTMYSRMTVQSESIWSYDRLDNLVCRVFKVPSLPVPKPKLARGTAA